MTRLITPQLIRIFTILSMLVFYFEVSRHRSPPQQQAPLQPSNGPTPGSSESASGGDCIVGHVYGSCFNAIRYFQCTSTGIVPRPCPAGQYFFCTGDGKGTCEGKRSAVGEGCEMVCDGNEELGTCRDVV
jgi:hypothetical protein